MNRLELPSFGFRFVYTVIIKFKSPTELFELWKQNVQIIGSKVFLGVIRSFNTQLQVRYVSVRQKLIPQIGVASCIPIIPIKFPNRCDDAMGVRVVFNINVRSFAVGNCEKRNLKPFDLFKLIKNSLCFVSCNFQIQPYSLTLPEKVPKSPEFCLFGQSCLKPMRHTFQHETADRYRHTEDGCAGCRPFQKVSVQKEDRANAHSKKEGAKTPQKKFSPIKLHLSSVDHLQRLKSFFSFSKKLVLAS